jgi:hypothetical protein
MTRKESALLAQQRDNFGDLHRAASSDRIKSEKVDVDVNEIIIRPTAQG